MSTFGGTNNLKPCVAPFAFRASEVVEDEQIDAGIERFENMSFRFGQTVLIEPAAPRPLATRLPDIEVLAE